MENIFNGGKMADKTLVEQNSEYIQNMPEWGQELSLKYCAKTVNLYFVSGNIRDLLPYKYTDDSTGTFIFVPIKDWISTVLFGNDGIIIFYDSSQGISFAFERDRKNYEAVMSRIYPHEDQVNFFSNDPMVALDYIEKFFRQMYYDQQTMKEPTRIVLILDYAETIVPAGEIYSLNEADRYCLVTLNRWANEPMFIRHDISIVMVTENINDINPRLASLASTAKVTIPLPDEQIRTGYLSALKSGAEPDLELNTARGVSVFALGKLSAGLNLTNLYQLVADAYQARVPITLDYLAQKKKDIIEKDADGLLTFVETKYTLDYVAGNEFVKKRLWLAAKAIKDGHSEVVPMGYLVSGAIGTGKTFLVSAFANEIGIPMVKIGNITSAMNGATESKLERILNILKAMAPVAVMIDEADVMLGGSRGSKSASNQTSFFSQLSNFMGNTEYRGKIIWFLITCRPDLLPIDLKRQGRAEEHLALFYPETVEEKAALFAVLQKKLQLKISGVDFSKVVKAIKFDVSGADIESILVRARLHANGENRVMITENDLQETIRDFLPPTYPHEIELQNLVATLECTSKELIPKKYHNKDRATLVAEINQLKQLLGEVNT
jgi:ATPase, AAA family